VAAKSVKFLYLKRRKGVISTLYNDSLADRSCRRQSSVWPTPQFSR